MTLSVNAYAAMEAGQALVPWWGGAISTPLVRFVSWQAQRRWSDLC